ncbi:MAG TPA: hypothetical protein VK402_21180 [Blastococcus sp.]|nr:hypothetical protein [Blastococcus sp.]
MAADAAAAAHIGQLLRPGEHLGRVVRGQLKPGGAGKRLAGDLAVSVALSAVGAVGGVGVVRGTTPAPVWVAVTSHRILVFLWKQGRRPVDRQIGEFDRRGVEVREQPSIMRTVVVTDRASRQTVLRLNFGFLAGRARALVAAAA